MKFENSPSLGEYKHGLPERPPDSTTRRRRLRIVILIVLLFVLLLGAANLMKSQTGGILMGTGAVRGVVVDQNGAPFHGRIFILGTKLAAVTDSNGRFQLDRVPAGAQSLIVADNLVGRDFPVQVIAGQTADVGQIEFIPTATP